MITDFTFDVYGSAQYHFGWAAQRVSDSTIVSSGSTGLFTTDTNAAINYTGDRGATYDLVLTRTGGDGSKFLHRHR